MGEGGVAVRRTSRFDLAKDEHDRFMAFLFSLILNPAALQDHLPASCLQMLSEALRKPSKFRPGRLKCREAQAVAAAIERDSTFCFSTIDVSTDENHHTTA